MQDNILTPFPSADLKVYTVWVPMMLADARVAIDTSLMPDPRVEHYWDGDKIASAWLALELDGYDGTVWDIYYLYGPEAAWADIPEPRLSVGTPIFYERDALLAALKPMLEGQ